MKRVVIVGMGFGGLEAAKALAGKGLEVLILDRQNHHLFQPLLYQVATATLEAPSIAYPIRSIIRKWPGVRFQMSEVRGVDLERREVIISDDSRISYDYLILAAGSVSNYFGMESVQACGYDLKQLLDGIALRNHMLTMYERAAGESDPQRRRALMTFVVVGGGPTGVEFSGALAELARCVLVKDFPDLRTEPRIILLEMMDRILATFPEDLRRYAMDRLRTIGVDVRLNTALSAAEADKVMLKDGSTIDAYTLFWAAGVKTNPLSEAIPVEKARQGRIPVGPQLNIESHPEVYVIGDMAHFEQEGAALPMVAQVAMQMGKHAARAIVAGEHGRALPAFRYNDKGSMAVIGRNAAVAQVFGMRFTGFIAWFIWLGLHLMMLVGFRNRIFTLMNWAYDYLLFERQIRIITRQSKREEVSLPDQREAPAEKARG